MNQIYIEGPVNLVELKILSLNKHFYIFGDEHTHNVHCINPNTNTIRIDNFLEEILLDNQTQIIDLFLELDFPHIDRDIKYQIERKSDIVSYLSTPDYLTDIYHKFYNCFQLNKEKCIYKNLRAHYTDTRSIDISKVIMDYIKEVNSTYAQIQFLKSIFRYNQHANREPIIHIINDGLRILNTLPVNIDDAYKTSKINKQIENINDIKLVLLIRNFFDAKLWNLLVKADEEYASYTEQTDIELIKVGINYLFEYASLLMEIYIISRMLRSFKTYESKNIILYAGLHHAKHITEFLLTIPSSILIEQSYSYEQNINFQCLNISNFDIPFFSN